VTSCSEIDEAAAIEVICCCFCGIELMRRIVDQDRASSVSPHIGHWTAQAPMNADPGLSPGSSSSTARAPEAHEPACSSVVVFLVADPLSTVRL
jgi:hypothetical protein